MTRHRILVTRAAHQASQLADILRSLDAEPIVIPAIEIVAPSDNFASLDRAITELSSFDWLVLTSTNAVDALAARLQQRTLSLPSALRVAAIGALTARHASERLQISLDSILLPPQAIAESLAETLLPYAMQPDRASRFVLVSAEEARGIFPDALLLVGAQVTHAAAYRHILPAASVVAMSDLFGDGDQHPDAITFTSASTVRNTLALLAAADVSLPVNVVLASIGPITSSALRDFGHTPHIESTEASVLVLATELVAYLNKHNRSSQTC